MPFLPNLRKPYKRGKAQPNKSQEEVYNKNRHKELSHKYRKRNPLCEVCLHYGILTDITPGKRKGSLDHIIPLHYGGSQDNPENLMGLCEGIDSCHRRKSTLENKMDRPLIQSKLDASGNYVPLDRTQIYKYLKPNCYEEKKGPNDDKEIYYF
jgi:hypothetical protein